MSSTASNVKSSRPSQIFSNIPTTKDVKCIRVDFLELQLKECQAREQASKQVTDQIIKAIEQPQLLPSSDANLINGCRSPLEVLEEQHKSHMASLKESFAAQMRRVQSELDALSIDHTLLKAAHASLEESRDALLKTSMSEIAQLKSENEFLQSKIVSLKGQIDDFQHSENQKNVRIEQMISDRIASATRIEILKAQAKIDTILYESKSEKEAIIKEHQEQQMHTQSESIKLSQQLAISEQLRQHLEKQLQEMQNQTLLKDSYLQSLSGELAAVKQEKFMLSKDLAGYLELPGYVRQLEAQLKALRTANQSSDNFQEKYYKLEQKYLVAQQEASQAKCEAKIATMHSKLQAEDWRKGIKKERKKSADLANRMSVTQSDYSKKASTIVSQILIQDSTIKTLSKRLSQSILNKSTTCTSHMCGSTLATDASQIVVLPSSVLDNYSRPIYVEADAAISTESDVLYGNTSSDRSRYVHHSPIAMREDNEAANAEDQQQQQQYLLSQQQRKPFADKLHKMINNTTGASKSEIGNKSTFKRVNSSISLRGKSKGRPAPANESFDTRRAKIS